MKIIVKEPCKKGEVIEVENNLETFQKIVGGYIEVYPIFEDMLIILNEEGKLKNLEPNLILKNDVIVGTVAIAGRGEEDFISLTDEQIDIIRLIKLI